MCASLFTHEPPALTPHDNNLHIKACFMMRQAHIICSTLYRWLIVSFCLHTVLKRKTISPSMCSPCWIPSLRSTWAVRRSLCWRASARGPWHRTRGHRVAELCGRIMWLKWNYTVVLSTRCMTLKSEVQLTFPPQSAVSPGLCEASGLPNYTDRESLVRIIMS